MSFHLFYHDTTTYKTYTLSGLRNLSDLRKILEGMTGMEPGPGNPTADEKYLLDKYIEKVSQPGVSAAGALYEAVADLENVFALRRRKAQIKAAIHASDFEAHIINVVRLDATPLEALKHYVQSAGEGVPTAIANHPQHGWAVISSAGQGPFFLWKEKPAKTSLSMTDAIEEENQLQKTMDAVTFTSEGGYSLDNCVADDIFRLKGDVPLCVCADTNKIARMRARRYFPDIPLKHILIVTPSNWEKIRGRNLLACYTKGSLPPGEARRMVMYRIESRGCGLCKDYKPLPMFLG